MAPGEHGVCRGAVVQCMLLIQTLLTLFTSEGCCAREGITGERRQRERCSLGGGEEEYGTMRSGGCYSTPAPGLL